MWKRLFLAMMCLALAAPASILPATAGPAQNSGCHATTATPPKAKDRKPASQPEKKRPSTTLGQGCIGCIVPLDGISSTMAIAPRFPVKQRVF
jgi:hypothetical protein